MSNKWGKTKWVLCSMAIAYMVTTCTTGCVTEIKAEPLILEPTTQEKVNGLDFEDVVAVDNEKYSITYTELTGERKYNTSRGIGVELVNKTNATPVRFTLKGLSINNIQMYSFYADVVNPFATSSKYIELLGCNALTALGVKEYTDIEIVFVVQIGYEPDTMQEETVTSHIYPYGEENAVQYERPTSETDRVLLDNQFISIITVGENKEGLYVINKTDKELYLTLVASLQKDAGEVTLFSNTMQASKVMFLKTPTDSTDLDYKQRLGVFLCNLSESKVLVSEEVTI